MPVLEAYRIDLAIKHATLLNAQVSTATMMLHILNSDYKTLHRSISTAGQRKDSSLLCKPKPKPEDHTKVNVLGTQSRDVSQSLKIGLHRKRNIAEPSIAMICQTLDQSLFIP